MNQLEALENLLIVTLLQQPKIIDYNNGLIKHVEIQLAEGKAIFLTKYIARYKLENHVIISSDSNIIQIQTSITVERIVRDWTTQGIVIGLNPSKISSDLFMLWVCLFGRKTENHVVIDTSLEVPVKETISLFFNQYLHTNLLDKGKIFQIMSFTNILLKSYQEKRSLEETEELNKLLTDKERNKLKKILIRWGNLNEVN